MKKSLIILGVLVFIIAVYFTFFSRTPEKILADQFNLSLDGYEYSVIDSKEQWDYNGDGCNYIVFKIESSFKEEILKKSDVKQLPIKQTFPVNEIPKKYLEINAGLYTYESMSDSDERDFKTIIYDEENGVLVLYYQLM